MKTLSAIIAAIVSACQPAPRCVTPTAEFLETPGAMAQLQVAIEAWGPAGLELDTDDAACPYSVEVMSDETLDELKRLPGWNGKPIEGAQVDGVISVRRDRLEDGCAIGTLAHELGHLMGLPHSEESGSVMVEEQDSVCAMPAPTAEDYRVMRGLL